MNTQISNRHGLAYSKFAKNKRNSTPFLMNNRSDSLIDSLLNDLDPDQSSYISSLLNEQAKKKLKTQTETIVQTDPFSTIKQKNIVNVLNNFTSQQFNNITDQIQTFPFIQEIESYIKHLSQPKLSNFHFPLTNDQKISSKILKEQMFNSTKQILKHKRQSQQQQNQQKNSVQQKIELLRSNQTILLNLVFKLGNQLDKIKEQLNKQKLGKQQLQKTMICFQKQLNRLKKDKYNNYISHSQRTTIQNNSLDFRYSIKKGKKRERIERLSQLYHD